MNIFYIETVGWHFLRHFYWILKFSGFRMLVVYWLIEFPSSFRLLIKKIRQMFVLGIWIISNYSLNLNCNQMILQQKKPHQYSMLNWVETHFLNEDTIIQIKYVAIALICESKIVIITTTRKINLECKTCSLPQRWFGKFQFN